MTDNSSATLARNLTLGGNLLLSSHSTVLSAIDVNAAAKGNDPLGNKIDTDILKQKNFSVNILGISISQNYPDVLGAIQNVSNIAQNWTSTGSSSLGVAAAAAMNFANSSNIARIENGADVTATGSITVSAQAQIDGLVKAVGTSINLTNQNSSSVGAAVSFNSSSLDNLATTSPGSVLRGQAISLEAVAPDGQMNEQTVWAAAAGGGFGDVGVAGSVAINSVDIVSHAAALADSQSASQLKSAVDLRIAASTLVRLQGLAAGAGFSSGTSVGGAVMYGNIDIDTRAYASGDIDAGRLMSITSRTDIGPGTVVQLPLGISIDASSLALAGAATSGNVGVAGSLVVNDFDLITQAYIDNNSLVNQDPTIVAAPNQSISVTAGDNTVLKSLAGALSVSAGSTAVGAGFDIAVIDKDTRAYLGNNSQTKSAGETFG